MSCRPECGRLSAGRMAHCGTCHRTFSGVSSFDAHRKAGECDVSKLRIDFRGVWREPPRPGGSWWARSDENASGVGTGTPETLEAL